MIIQSNIPISDPHNDRKAVSAYKNNKKHLDSPVKRSPQTSSNTKPLKKYTCN